jgi:hypothetical protein
VSAHRECLDHAAGLVDAEAKGRTDGSRDTLKLAAAQLRLAAKDAGLVPADVAEEREAVARFVLDHIGGCLSVPQLQRAPQQSIDAWAREVAYVTADAIRTGKHAHWIEVIREEKRPKRTRRKDP